MSAFQAGMVRLDDSANPDSMPQGGLMAAAAGGGDMKVTPASRRCAEPSAARHLLKLGWSDHRASVRLKGRKTRSARSRIQTLFARRIHVELRTGRCALKHNESLQMPTPRRLILSGLRRFSACVSFCSIPQLPETAS